MLKVHKGEVEEGRVGRSEQLKPKSKSSQTNKDKRKLAGNAAKVSILMSSQRL